MTDAKQLPLFDETPDELWWAERQRVIRDRLAELALAEMYQDDHTVEALEELHGMLHKEET